MRKPTAISTFSGCGGSSTGYKAAGYEMVACVEWEAHAVECYALNHPTTEIFHRDIAKVTGAEILQRTGLKVGELDLLDGSPPCQGFSTAGQRVLDDPRNKLFQQHMRLVDELRPKTVVIENVTGMIKGHMKPVASEIIRSLQSRGYQVKACVLNALWLGVAQTRQRVYFIASRVGAPSLPPPTHWKALTCGRALRDVTPDEILIPTAASSRFFLDRARPGDTGSDVLKRLGRKPNWFGSQMLHPDRPAPTFTKTMGGAGGFYHWERRRLAINEALVLTGFPANYRLTGSYMKRWARIGNSVAPPMAKAVGLALKPLVTVGT